MGIRKVLLVHSAHHAEDGSLVKAGGGLDRLLVANIAELALPLLAALTPSSIQVEMVDEYFEQVPFDSDADVVGISAQVMQLSRAIELASVFRKQGKVVIMGGFLPSMHPELVEAHVDSLCIGEGDIVWPQMLEDLQNGVLRKTYRSEHQTDLATLPVPRYGLIKRGRWVNYPVQATRGCPFTCDYCSIIQLYPVYRTRAVAQVIRDIRAIPSRYLHFVDDNLMENRKYAKQLMQAMIPLKRIWGAQVTINVARDDELLRLAYQAGCRMLALGIETLDQRSLASVSKDFIQVDTFSSSIQKIQQAGIAAHALIVFGLEHDTPDTFRQTVDYLERECVAVAEFFIYTPYPATPEGRRLLEAGRIVDTDLSHYRESYVVFSHPNMSREQIIEGYWYALRRFYSLRSILRRIWHGRFRNKFLHLVNNLVYWVKVRRQIVPVYFGRGN
jgi:radical SAM superfamily enzyme YgiQ (UPF0313 family)